MRFFLKHRKEIIEKSRSNRIVKYILYAIGELILIVLGIYIALYLNDIQSKKEAKIKEQIMVENCIDKSMMLYDRFCTFNLSVEGETFDIGYRDFHLDSDLIGLNVEIRSYLDRYGLRKSSSIISQLFNENDLSIITDLDLKNELLDLHESIEIFESKVQDGNINFNFLNQKWYELRLKFPDVDSLKQSYEYKLFCNTLYDEYLLYSEYTYEVKTKLESVINMLHIHKYKSTSLNEKLAEKIFRKINEIPEGEMYRHQPDDFIYDYPSTIKFEPKYDYPKVIMMDEVKNHYLFPNPLLSEEEKLSIQNQILDLIK